MRRVGLPLIDVHGAYGSGGAFISRYSMLNIGGVVFDTRKPCSVTNNFLYASVGIISQYTEVLRALWHMLIWS